MSDVLVSTEQQSAVLTFNRAAQNNSIGTRCSMLLATWSACSML